MTIEHSLKPDTRDRTEIPERYTWDLSHIYPDWASWQTDLERLQELMDSYQELKGTLAEGPEKILEASLLSDDLGQLAYRVYQYPGLMQSQDTRDNAVQARLEQVRLALAAFRQATAWYTPELLEIPEETMQGWLDDTPELAPYRFGIEESYRMQQHVLDDICRHSGADVLDAGRRRRQVPDRHSFRRQRDCRQSRQLLARPAYAPQSGRP